MRASTNGYQSTTPDGSALHTSIPVVVRRVRFVEDPRRGQVVEVMATVGESEVAIKAVKLQMNYEQALAADIIEKVR